MTKRTAANLSLPAPISAFLTAASQRAGVDPAAILESTLGTRPVTSYADAQPLIAKINPEAIEVLEELDRTLRVANPGSQLVFRSGYIGYRRFDTRQPNGVKASRSQVYASILPRQTFIRVVVPLDTANHHGLKGVSDLSGKGHHGIGDMAIDLHSVEDVRAVVSALDHWLGPAPR